MATSGVARGVVFLMLFEEDGLARPPAQHAITDELRKSGSRASSRDVPRAGQNGSPNWTGNHNVTWLSVRPAQGTYRQPPKAIGGSP